MMGKVLSFQPLISPSPNGRAGDISSLLAAHLGTQLDTSSASCRGGQGRSSDAKPRAWASVITRSQT